MYKRDFLRSSIVIGASTLGLSACSTLPSFGNLKPLIKEFDGHLDSAPKYWTNVILHAMRSTNSSPLMASRSFAMAHYAGYLAMTGNGLGILGNQQPPASVNADIAYAAGFSYALEEALSTSFLLPRNNYIQHYQRKNSTQSSNISESVRWGKSQAQRVIKLRTRDGSQVSLSNHYLSQYPKQNHSLSWSPTGPFYGAKNGPSFQPFERGANPAWGAQKTWLIDNVKNYEAIPFPKLGSAEFARQFKKVKQLGDSNNPERTAEQDEIALFWEDGLMGVTVPGHFQLIAMQLLIQNPKPTEQEARLFALLSMAQADAGIIGWHNKYLYDVIRPETAIRFAHSRFNKPSELKENKRWNSYIPTPPFPAYISGHSIFGAASCDVMAAFFGSDSISLTSPTPDLVNWPSQLKGVRRSFNSLRQIAEENGISREYGGVHWEIDNTEGLRLGYDLAKVAASKLHLV